MKKNVAIKAVSAFELYLRSLGQDNLVVQKYRQKGIKGSYGLSLSSTETTLRQLYSLTLSAMQHVDVNFMEGGCSNISLHGMDGVGKSISILPSIEEVEKLLLVNEEMVQIPFGDRVPDPELDVHNQIREMFDKEVIVKYCIDPRRYNRIFIGGFDSLEDAAYALEQIVISHSVEWITFIDTHVGEVEEIDEELWPGRYWVSASLDDMEFDEDS